MGAGFEDLTERERECLYLATLFMRPKEIAGQIGGSPRTVETHLSRAAVKLGAANPREAAKLYAEYLGRYGSGNAPTETPRLSGLATAQSSTAQQNAAEEPKDYAVRESPATLYGSIEPRPFHGKFAWPRKGLTPDDMTLTQMLFVIVMGAILAAIAIIVAVAMTDAFQRLASLFSRP